MATGSARVNIIASSGEPEPVEVPSQEFGIPNPRFQQVPEKTLVTATNGAVPVVLNPARPFDAILIEMLAIHRAKSADYANDSDPLSNFFETAEIMREEGYSDLDAFASVVYALAIKKARLRTLKRNGRLDQPSNESVRDTLLDEANYAVLRLAVYDRLHPKASEAI